ncbi:FolB domain-containing protein [Carboxylicivirga sediminis]|uniref:Dihydroneopterin triphosphate 2'-epimerase n=1 Tax=Carboxylicivirga sediminis TaxID=2006564 RepID=A0A941IZ76_9BACT|nr:FolB domain-containing protein [Carboxylicivirga sediminis]MBR8537194.1 FolB domain-containing protein [Carboxylicivirga sediminis]
MGKLKIKNLLLRSYVGFNPHEIGKRQDVMLNITIHYASGKEELSDLPDDALDYRTITKQIIEKVENSRFNLLEALARMILDTIMQYERVQSVEVEVDKLHALRFSESVSITLSAQK